MTRIAVVSPSTDAYSETFISSHIELLPAKVHVLSGGHLPTYGDGHSLVKDYSLPKRIRFRLGQQRRGLAWDGQAKHIATIEEFLRRHQIQAVLAEYGPTGVAMMEVCERAGIPLVVHFHGYDAFSQEVVAEYRKSYHQLFSRCAALVASSYFMKDRLISLGAPHRLVQRNPYGVDITKFRTTSPEKNVAALLAVGRFVNKKAPYLTLLAFYQAQQVVDELRLIMVGDGPIWETCVRLSGVLGIGDKVDFLGVQSPDEIVELMKRARGFVQHSVTSLNGDSESLGVVFLEAGASGLPVISTRHDGIPEVVINGETGFLVDELDVDGMAQAMIRLASEPRLAAQLGQAGRRRIEEHFSMEKSIDNLWRIIESAIASKSQIADPISSNDRAL